ncbi:MAG: hypothetical protein K9N46_01660 [Candidatus Marinimicrobia bacterium]|nr:hypothetical protein [Candidatus Neomarinimicrobiota bacterium]MCF7827816.1 hypothetical protein [Candidatus Neomarinimicrobiota bacterium]MCF7879429.1 hypothetical protein [Candidatus Neomarinimicrobiota bacterium]
MKSVQRIISLGCILGLFAASATTAQTTIPFTKPDMTMNIPTSSQHRAPYMFRAGFVGSVYKFAPDFASGKGLYFDTEFANALSLGFSAIKGADDTLPVLYGLHLKKRIFSYEEISVSAGLYNVMFQNDVANDQLTLQENNVSMFAVIANEKQMDDFVLNTYMGFGTGLLASSFTGGGETSISTAGVFAGFRMTTETLQHHGGVDFIGEYDGQGLNVGVKIPFTENYNINFGVQRIDNLPKLGTNVSRRPGIILGMEMTIPRYTDFGKRAPRGVLGTDKDLVAMQEHYEAKIDSILRVKNRRIQTLEDSVKITLAEIDRLQNEVAMLQQQTSVLKDSVQRVKLQKHVTEQNINLALKHLSRSLRYFYAGNYKEALQEVDIAIELNDNLALAYARRGSIYYKLGDVDRATINWNLALQIDPEYDDVRNILRALNENRLQTTSTINRN